MMSKKVLTALRNEGALTTAELAARLEIEEHRARKVIAELRRDGCLVSRPTTYTLTPKGEERQRFVRKVYVKKGRAPRKAISSVERAIKTQPNSVFALGGM